ncbi:hypothetical protein C10C_0741 [Chlamydia serpentis]|uniref:Uncharacterized protein n=1 Tax=Chlamydia serpentis TaxID=1967782 RepID=A0A2R8FBS4_9CHLA|nr:hypothetical protein [Chlamydia serpentis]SPN73885.1 hypothetical protein C10C_0741 [Chlamydia serpentis]
MEKLEFVASPPPSDDDLITFNKQGLIPGPEEEAVAFFLRSNAMIDLGPQNPPSFPAFLKEIFDVLPMHVEVLYSNEGLDAWEAGCTWILKNQVTIQIRKHLLKASRWLGIYSRDEVLAHEAVHAARMKFYEPIFEEVLAYRTSRWGWRRFFGPLFRSPGESYLFLFFTILGLGISLWYPIMGMLMMLALPGYFFLRLCIVQSYFYRAMKKIRKMLGIPPLWVMLRLTDREIKMFAREPIPVLENYARKRKLENVRWKQIYQSYFI